MPLTNDCVSEPTIIGVVKRARGGSLFLVSDLGVPTEMQDMNALEYDASQVLAASSSPRQDSIVLSPALEHRASAIEMDVCLTQHFSKLNPFSSPQLGGANPQPDWYSDISQVEKLTCAEQAGTSSH